MVDIAFYQLTLLPFEKSIAQLLEKAYEGGKRVVMRCGNEEQLETLNHFLWTYKSQSFLPHGSQKQGFAADQPIWLTTAFENPNNASILMILDGSKIDDFQKFDRCLDLFDGQNPIDLEKAQKRWEAYHLEGHTLKYWQQSESGAWGMKR